jgi:glycosyltransferase involved in cell wall biosynthesis
MSSSPHRVGVITEIPTPYRLPMYERLAARSDIDLEVLFCAAEEPDRPWRANSGLAKVPHRFMRGWAPTIRTRRNTFVYEINRDVLRILRRARYDAIVIGGYSVFAEQAAIIWARASGTPYLLHSESHAHKARGSLKLLAKSMLVPQFVAHAAAGLAVGTLAAEYLESYGLPREQIRLVPNTIDVDAYASVAAATRADATTVRARYDLPPRYLFYAGRLVEVKGIRELLVAHRNLGPTAPPLLIAGDGPLRTEVSAAENVRWLGFRQPNELNELFALADRTIVPSLSEPWGVVVNEALASGSPVIATDAVGAAHDLVREGVNGAIVPTGDVTALTRALSRVMPPLNPAEGAIKRWDYSFAVEGFVEGVRLALGAI